MLLALSGVAETRWVEGQEKSAEIDLGIFRLYAFYGHHQEADAVAPDL